MEKLSAFDSIIMEMIRRWWIARKGAHLCARYKYKEQEQMNFTSIGFFRSASTSLIFVLSLIARLTYVSHLNLSN